MCFIIKKNKIFILKKIKIINIVNLIKNSKGIKNINFLLIYNNILKFKRN